MSTRFSEARIVVIDDTPANVDLLDNLLRRVGFRHVYSLTDSRGALGLVERLDADLVLLDLHMPQIDGFVILEELVKRAAGSYQPVLVLTADTTPEASHRALSLGAKDFLRKPFDLTEVVLRVETLLETRALHQRLRRQSSAMAGELDQIRSHERQGTAAREAKRAAVQAALAPSAINMVIQPIVDLTRNEAAGYEALARFTIEPLRTPDVWFGDAAEVGLGQDLELVAVRQALQILADIPSPAFLAVNISPATLLLDELRVLLSAVEAHRVVLELTEHQAIEDYQPITTALAALRAQGVRFGVDDAGAGFASLRHILALQPDIIKLDISLVRDVDQDPARRALTSCMARFATETGATIVAEGVETAEELATLASLDVRWAQGYYLARPADPQTFLGSDRLATACN